ncbi:hypothetical protein RIF29_16766 [Crotalaria pallida]|uniref:LysM domain-containing protein n=1 Tax=Crotalaria pallida TaxID=3830 RepID=A0AAN9FHZ1_CROPI
MASLNYLSPLLPLLATLIVTVYGFNNASIEPAASFIEPFNCSEQITTCNALLYHIDHNFKIEEIASFYNVNSTQIKPITHGNNQDYLIQVPCSCKNTNNLSGYFYDTSYIVKPNDTFFNVSEQIYGGQAWPIQDSILVPGEELPIHLVCGCAEPEIGASHIIVTYTVQANDTLEGIATLLSSDTKSIVSLNKVLQQNPSFIDVGWVLFVKMK